MPDPVVHASFGREVLASLPEEVREAILPDPYTFALFGPDPWFMYKPLAHGEGRGRRMHTTKPGAFLTALVRRAGHSVCRAEMFSYLAGFLCHYALDSFTHPYVIWVTTQEHVFPRSHMSLEHALDAVTARRDGVWGTRHPVTDHYFPPVSLPEIMRGDLDAVYEEVYGWKGCWADLNRCLRRYRRVFRLMDSPRGLAVLLTRLTRKDALKSVTYTESHFHTLDPENTEHRTWRHPFDPTQCFSESFPELREKALRFAADVITAAWRYLARGEGTEEALAARIGNRSYLSGLPADDPRNLTVPSMLPPGPDEKEAT